jgi:hypothetical protein
MKRARFSERQIAYILRLAEEGTSVEKVCRKAGISEATYYTEYSIRADLKCKIRYADPR